MLAPLVPPAVHTAGVVVAKLTARPDDAVPVTVTGDCVEVCVPGAANVIVCAALVTAKLRVTAGAGLNAVLPAWFATTVQVPVVTRVMLAPLVPPAVQTAAVVVVKVTGSPDDAVAVTATGDCARVRAGCAET